MTDWKSGILGSLVLAMITIGVFVTAGTVVAIGGTSIVSVPGTPLVASNHLNLTVTLIGRGATFPQPLLANWTSEYHSTHNNVTISYVGTGSGGGQNAFINKTVDFAASDAPLNPAQRVLTLGVLHIPETIGSVTASYNLPEYPKVGLNFTGSILADIYMGIIKKWNDSAIQNINPGAKTILPNTLITPVWRLESSGTTFVWSSFLCQDSGSFCSNLGPPSTVIPWKVGVGALHNDGVARFVNNTAYTLGYVELNYALQFGEPDGTNGLHYGRVQNPMGSYVLPSRPTTAFAVSNSTQSLPQGKDDWSKVSLLNANGTNTYPIASFTYLLVYRELNVVPSMDLADNVQWHALVNFLNWAITIGQTFAAGNYYVPLPSGVVAIDQASINSITYTPVSSPVARTFHLSADSTFGWNGTKPGPSITVVSGDHVTIDFSSNDSLTHIWYIDINNNRQQDLNETNIQFSFSSPTFTPYTFTPIIWNQTSLPSSGTFFYRDANNANINGTITVLPQQVAAVFKSPNSLKTTMTNNPPHIDTSNVGTIGSLVIDMRTNTASGDITIVAVDHVSGAQSPATHALVLSGLQLRGVSGSPGLLQLRFLMNIAVTPYSLSSDILIQLQGTTATATWFLTRELDLQHQLVVNILDVTSVLSIYGTSIGSPGFNYLADFNADGTINILDVGPLVANFNAQVFY